jgi:hypothetical protein
MEKRVGIAVGRQTHCLLLVEGEKIESEYIANSLTGLTRALVLAIALEIKEIYILGNRRWATPFCYGLKDRGLEPFFIPVATERGKRGARGNNEKLLGGLLKDSSFPRKPFFKEQMVVSEPPILRLVHEYIEATDKVRELKHRIMDSLCLLFPEAVKAGTTEKRIGDQTFSLPLPDPQPPDLFLKKMKKVLENPDIQVLQNNPDVPGEISTLAKTSLAKFLPPQNLEKLLSDHKELVESYYKWVGIKEEKMAAVAKIAKSHPLVEAFGGGDLAIILSASLGWRQWEKFNWLRHHVGLDVTRIDSRGRHHISRVRPWIRQYLYLLITRTNKGREMAGEIKKQAGGKIRRVKLLEKSLKIIWREYLKIGPILS